MLARVLGASVFGASALGIAWVGLKVWMGRQAPKNGTPTLPQALPSPPPPPLPPLAPLVLFTDLEPDDLMAMWVLKKRNITPTAIVVGEGNVGNKVARAVQYAKDLGWTRTLIRAGIPSSADTPDGEVPSINDADRAAVTTTWDMGTTLGLLELCRDPRPTFLCLKPPRELVSALAGGPCGALSHVRLCIYGSFNLRQVGLDKVVNWFNPDTTPFRQVVWYENYGGLSDDTRNLNPDTLRGALAELPDVADAANAMPNPFCGRASEFARVWDAYMVRDCQDLMAAIEARGAGWRSDPVAAQQHARNKRCLLELQKFQGRQVVAADPVLAVVMDDPDFEPYGCRVVSVTLPEGPESYPTVRMSGPPGGDAKVLKLINLPAEVVLAKLAPAWRDIFRA